MDRYTDQERAFCVEVYFQEKSYVKVQRAFRRKFKVPRHKPVPSWKSVKRWIANFRELGRVSDKKRPGKKRSIHTPENIEKVRNAIQVSPRRSARRHAASLQLKRESVRKILVEDLNFHPYKLIITQELKETDYRQRLIFAQTMLQKLEDREIVLNNLLMSDEAHFELSSNVNKQNYRYWTDDNPHWVQEKPLHSQRVTVWCAVAEWGIIGPYFFDGTVNGEQYRQMINSFLLPELRHRRRLSRTVFQQDGATCHTATETLAILKKAFGTRLLSRSIDFAWPPRSPDMTVPDFFLWGYLKSRVYQTRPQDLEDLKARIRQEIAAITPEMLIKVFKNFVQRLNNCVSHNGQHLKDVVFHK